jgi:hypothetical protein
VGERVASLVEWATLVNYNYGRHLLIPSEYDHMLLKQTWVMSDQQYAVFHWILVELTGMGLHISKTKLSALQDSRMPDYTFTMVISIVSIILQERRVFQVDRILQVIEIRVVKLMSHRGDFRLTSEKTALGDDNIRVRVGGDNGGK